MTRYWEAILSRWWLVVLCSAVGTAVAFGALALAPHRYEAAALVRVDVPAGQDGVPSPTAVTTLLAMEASVATSDAVLAQAARQSNGISPSQMKAALQITVTPDASMLQISASAPVRDVAVAIAHLDAQALMDYEAARIQRQNAAREKPLRDQIAATQARLTSLTKQLDALRQQGLPDSDPAVSSARDRVRSETDTLTTLTGNLVQLQYSEALQQPAFALVRDATPERAVAQPAMQKPLLAGTGSGLALGVVLATWLERRRKVRAPGEIKPLAGDAALVDLRALPRHEVARGQREGGALASAFSTLRMDLTFLGITRPLRMLVVTGTARGVGTSLAAAALAEQWGRAGKRVLLVDAHTEAPTLHARYDLLPMPGLTDAVAEARSPGFDLSAYLLPTPEPFLKLLAAGPQRRFERRVLGSAAFGLVVDALLATRAEVLVFDAPPVTTGGGLALARRADGVVLVADVAHHPARQVEEVLHALDQADAQLAAVILNRPPRGTARRASSHHQGTAPRIPEQPVAQSPAGAPPPSPEGTYSHTRRP